MEFGHNLEKELMGAADITTCFSVFNWHLILHRQFLCRGGS